MKTNFLSLFAAFLFASATFALGATNDLSGALQKGLFEEEANHNLEAAAQAYQSVAAQFDKDRKLAATAIFRLGEVYRKQGKTNEANAQYERILKEFPDQTELVKLSRTLGASGIGDQNSEIIRELEQNLVSAQLDYAKQKALFDTLTKLSGEQLRKSLPTIYPDSLFDALLVKLASAEQGLESRKQQFALDHPEVKKAQAILRLTEKQIDKRIDGIRSGLEAQVAVSKRRVEELQDQLNKARKEQPEKFRPQLAQVVQRTNSVSAEDQEIARIKTMIKDSPDLINAPQSNGLSPLAQASMMGQLQAAEFLLANGADASRGKPLLRAVENGHKSMVELLIDRGANVQTVDDTGQTSLHIAARKGFLTIAEILLKTKADVNSPDRKGNAPLHLAARAGNQAVAKLLLESGAEIDAKDSAGQTSLFGAITSKNLGMAKLLIANKADVNVRSRNGTPLFTAISAGLPEFVELLIRSGANVESKKEADSYQGFTPLAFAALSGEKEISEMLLKNGANPNATNDFGSTPLLLSVSSNNSIEDIRDIAELLLAHKADVNAKDKNGDTPLIAAVRRLAKPVVELLLEHGADPNVAIENALTPTRGNGVVLVPNSNVENEIGQSPLMIAQNRAGEVMPNGIINSSADIARAREIAELLIQHGADENYERRTQIAVTRDFKQVYPIFHKGTNSWNRFSLLETFGATYSSNPLRVGSDASPGFPFPKLSKIKIHRLEGKGEHEISVDLEAILKSGDCSKDIWLEWGDVVEFPEADHRVDEQWTGFPGELLETLPKCLTRNVSVTVKGETKTITFAPTLKKSQHPLGNEREKFADIWFNPLLYFGISRSGLLRTSSDQTRVKVTRINPVTKKSEEQMFNLEKPDSLNHFWLRDGDQIEIPEKP